ncbi:hypothetical protein TB2_043173 [Malus domestica]
MGRERKLHALLEPGQDRARGGRRLEKLRGGEEPFVYADETARRRGAELVAELLGARAEVPAANAGFD